MSVVVHEDKMELDEGLEWIKLRRELDNAREREMERLRPAYKYNWYMPVGVSITAALYFYGLYHMHDLKRSSRAAYCRITSQFICGTIFAYGFLKHHNKEIKLYKEEKKRRQPMHNVANSN